MNTRAWTRTVLLIVFGLTSAAAGCGDDSSSTPADAGAGKGGSGGKGGGGNGGSGNTGGSASGSGGSGGKASTGGSGGDEPPAKCTEAAPTTAVTCGGETCVAPSFENNMCIVSCCVSVNGQSKCGAKSTLEGYLADCTLPAEPDSACPAVEDFSGCCNRTLGKCGIISTLRPGCITESSAVTIPDHSCSKTSPNDNDAGPDAG